MHLLPLQGELLRSRPLCLHRYALASSSSCSRRRRMAVGTGSICRACVRLRAAVARRPLLGIVGIGNGAPQLHVHAALLLLRTGICTLLMACARCCSTALQLKQPDKRLPFCIKLIRCTLLLRLGLCTRPTTGTSSAPTPLGICGIGRGYTFPKQGQGQWPGMGCNSGICQALPLQHFVRSGWTV